MKITITKEAYCWGPGYVWLIAANGHIFPWGAEVPFCHAIQEVTQDKKGN